MEIRKLRKVNQAGERAIFYFRDSEGNIVRDIRTPEYYDSLKREGAEIPFYEEGYEYLYGELCPKYDTPDGDLPDDSYAELNQGKDVAIRLKEFPSKELFKEAVYLREEVNKDHQITIKN